MMRTHQTEIQYARRAAALIQRFMTATGADAFREEAFAHWLVSLRSELAPSTWRVYRIAGRHAVEGMPLEAIARKIFDVAPAPRPVRRGASLKAKRFPLRDRDRLVAVLALSRSERARSLSDWLQAGLATGLRPCEWSTVRLDGATLTVWTAKTTNGRGNGSRRHLDLSRLDRNAYEAVRRMATHGNQWHEDGLFDSEQEAHAALLRKVVRRTFGDGGLHVTLYSTRHQALSNAKAIHSREEVAALAGHGSIRTAARSYGRRRSAWAPGVATAALPSPSETLTVRSPYSTTGLTWALQHPILVAGG